MKNVLTHEREREKMDREKRRLEKEQEMDVDGVAPTTADSGFEEDAPTCKFIVLAHERVKLITFQTRRLKHLRRFFRRRNTVISLVLR